MKAGVGNVMPSLSKLGEPGISHTILDILFRDNALLFQQASLLYGSAATDTEIPAPLIGFYFEHPEQLVFAQYSYADYPYLNKAVVANSFIKNKVPVSIKAFRPITKGNSIASNYILNEYVIRKIIEKYADTGGLFMLNTMYGLVKDLALEEFSAEPVANQSGVGFVFRFSQLNFDKTSAVEKIVSKTLSSLGVQ